MQPARDLLRRIRHGSRRMLANLWLNTVHRNTTQIGITGSYGKTATTRAIYSVLAQKYAALMTDLNLDTLYNVPITALKLRGQRFVVFELGIDRPGEMDFHLEIARPQIGVVTGITPVHSDASHLGSVENIVREKRRLIEALPPGGAAILNFDDERVRSMAAFTRAEVVWYGADRSCGYRAEGIRSDLSGLKFRAVTPSGAFEVETPLVGRHNAINLLAATAVGERAGVSAAEMQAAFAGLQPLKGRMSVEPGPMGSILIDDALRANPASTKAGLAFLGDLTVAGRKIAVLGEMGELGDSEIPEHEEVGRFAATIGLDRLVCVGPLGAHIAGAARQAGLNDDRVISAANVHEVAEILRRTLQPGDALYLKGSLMRHMERVLLLLEGRTVGCRVVSCHFYHQCQDCRYLLEGYSESADHA